MARIALAVIKEPAFDSRTSKVTDAEEVAEIKSLAESFKLRGQLQPIEVEEVGDGSFIRVWGRRRIAAAHIAGWTDIEAIVKPLSNDNERMMRNIIENVKRKNLTTYEVARCCAEMRAKGLSNNDIASTLGFSMQKASNLGNRYEKLPAPILEEWKKNNPAATDEFLGEIASDKEYPTAEKKQQRWDERVAEIAAEVAAGKTPGQRGKGKEKGTGGGGQGFPVSQKRLGHCIEALSNAKGSPALSADVRNWARALLQFIVQGRDMPPDGVPALPAPVAKKEKAPRTVKAPTPAANAAPAVQAVK